MAHNNNPFSMLFLQGSECSNCCSRSCPKIRPSYVQGLSSVVLFRVLFNVLFRKSKTAFLPKKRGHFSPGVSVFTPYKI